MKRMSAGSPRRICLVIVISSISFNCHANNPNDDIYGYWKIKAILGGGISSLSERNERRLVGKSIIISRENFIFNGRTCAHPAYGRKKEDVDKYFYREWRADVTDIPLPNPVTIIDAQCNFLFPMKKDHLMIAEDGVFFEAVRVKK